MSVTIDPQLDQLLQNLSPKEQELLTQGLKKVFNSQNSTHSSEEDNLAETIRTWTEAEKIKLEIESLFRYFQRRRELLKNSLTASQVAKLLGTTRQTPHDRLKKSTLLGVRDNGVYHFPLWQFDPEGSDGVVEGLPAVLKTLQVSDFAKLNWLVSPNPYLDNLTPLEALKQGQKKRVITEATSVGVF